MAALFAAEVPNEGTGTGTRTGALNEGAPNVGALMAIINEGNDAFKAVHGRNMTYAEMRGLYG